VVGSGGANSGVFDRFNICKAHPHPNLRICVSSFFFLCAFLNRARSALRAPCGLGCEPIGGVRRFFEGVFGEFYCFLRWMDREGDGDTGSFGFCGGIGGG